MEMVRHKYIGNLQHDSTDIMRMHMDSEFWYQQHNFDSDAHHLNKHMIDTGTEVHEGRCNPNGIYFDLGIVVYESNHCKGILPGAN